MNGRTIHITARIIAVIIMMAIGHSCLRIERNPYEDKITLHASLMDQTTKASIGSDYNSDLPIALARVDVIDANRSFANCSDALKANMKPGETDKNVRDIEFSTYQTFKDATSEILYASWYPDNEVSDGVVSFNDIDGDTDIMYGTVASGTQSKGFNTIMFQHGLVKYTFHVYAMLKKNQNGDITHDSRETWGDIQSIKITGLGENMTLTLPHDGVNYTIEETGTKDYIVTGNSPLVAQNNIPTDHITAIALTPIMAPPPSGDDLTVKIITKKGDAEAVESTLSITKQFDRGKNYDIYLRFSDHGFIDPEVAVSEWESGNTLNENNIGNTYFDLSTTQTANCYIVSSANYGYCFNVTVKGNGPEGIIDEADPSLNIGYMDILWVENGLEDDFVLENIPHDGKIYFHLKGNEQDLTDKRMENEGSILLGGYDREGGELLWCWHLWVTDRPRELSLRNGFSTLDRDLGAIAADRASASNDSPTQNVTAFDGLYYQWGRPTPLPLGKTLSESKTFIPNTSEHVKMYDRSKNPFDFYTKVPDSEHTTSLWGYRPETQEYTKTIYDPCPAGYRVPSYKLTHNMDIELDHVGGDNHLIHYITETNHDMFFPINGYWYYDSGSNSIKRNGYLIDENTSGENDFGSYVWLATTTKENTGIYEPYLMDIIVDGSENNYQVQEVHTTNKPGYPATVAMPVRCVSRRSHSEVKDLSASQTANSYIVSEAGYYKFKATVRGNGVGKLVAAGSAGYIDISEGLQTDISRELARVDTLWWQGSLSGTNDGSYIPVKMENDGKPDNDGYVTFRIDRFEEGNMILAGRDARENIIWSWHIWLTDEPEIHNSLDYAVMDRFLGATEAPKVSAVPANVLPTYGLYYQWGRKDPFPGPASSSTTDNTTSKWWTYDKGQGKWISNDHFANTTNVVSEKSVANSISDPTRYHLSTDDIFSGNDIPDLLGYNITDDVNNYDNQCFSTLINAASLTSFWGYSSAGGFGKTSSKTMYDPCPPGYTVAYYLVWTYADREKGTNTTYCYTDKDWNNYSQTNGYGVITNANGIFLNKEYYDKSWYPYTGYIDSNTGYFRQVGSVGRFHSSTPAGNSSRSLFYYKDGSNAYTGQAVSYNYRGIPSTYGYPVRCQKE